MTASNKLIRFLVRQLPETATGIHCNCLADTLPYTHYVIKAHQHKKKKQNGREETHRGAEQRERRKYRSGRNVKIICAFIVGYLRFTNFCWVGKHVNILMKPTNFPTQGQPNPIQNMLTVAFGPLFPTANNFSWIGINFI